MYRDVYTMQVKQRHWHRITFAKNLEENTKNDELDLGSLVPLENEVEIQSLQEE